MGRSRASAALLWVIAVLATGCGSSGETGSAPEESAARGTKTTAARAESPGKDLSELEKTPAEEAQLRKEYADASRWKVLKKAAGDRASRLIVPVGPPPEDKILIRELREGSGAKLERHDQYILQYLGFDYSGGELVENSWNEEGVWFVFGTGETNKAREVGLKGMRVGGVREVVAPASWLHDNDAAVYLYRLAKVFKE